MIKNNFLKGREGEEKASRYLRKNGYRIIQRNYNVSGGETDIIARKDGYIIFCEVKTRKDDSFGNACEAVDEKKRAHMLKSADRFIYENRGNNKIKDLQPRFDVIEVYTQKDEIRHIKNIEI